MTTRARIYDQYFTPSGLAEKLLAAFTISNPREIGDFAVGDGELLRAAEKRWPLIKCIAIDIDNEVVTKLRTTHAKWSVDCYDFTDSESRRNLLVKRGKPLKLHAIALNPPFSIRKGEVRVRTVSIAGISVRSSPALSFVIDALTYLKRGGQLVAIVPHGVIQNAQDAQARELLAQHYGFEIVELISQAGFTNCTPRTAIVRFTAGITKTTPSITTAILPCGNIAARLVRGSISNTTVEHSCHPSSLPFIHTTDLLQGLLIGPKKNILLPSAGYATGPAVLIPRVGKPTSTKVTYLPSGFKAVLSDCVMAVECVTQQDAETLHSWLEENWLTLEQAYGGTCARYISVQDFSTFLKNLGCELHNCLCTFKSDAIHQLN